MSRSPIDIDYSNSLDQAFNDIEYNARLQLYRKIETCDHVLQNEDLAVLSATSIGVITALDYLFSGLRRYTASLERYIKDMSE